MRECDGQTRTIECGTELMQAGWTVGRAAHVIFARPDHFHRSVDRLRNLRGFDGIIVFQPAAEASAHQRDIHLYLIGIESDRSRD